METGSTIYRGTAFSGSDNAPRWYITEATVTGIEVDGVLMAKMGALLVPASDYVATRDEAKRQIIRQLRDIADGIHVSIEKLMAEISQ